MPRMVNEIECLSYYDGPLISIMDDEYGNLYYVHWLDWDGKEGLWSATPVTQELIQQIKSGEVDLRSLITHESTKVFSDVDYILRDDLEIHPGSIPDAGVTLYHMVEPPIKENKDE